MQNFNKILVFFIVNVLLICLCFLCFKAPSRFDVLYNEFLNGSYNAVVVGQSYSRFGINPFYLTNEGLDSVFNLSQGGLSLKDSYYIIKDLLDRTDVDKIYFEINYQYWLTSNFDYPYTGIVDLSSILKFKNVFGYFFDVMSHCRFVDIFLGYRIDADSIINIPNTIHLNLMDKHSMTISDLNQSNNRVYKGRGFEYMFNTNEYKAPFYANFDTLRIGSEAFKIFSKIVELCKANDVTFICYSSALPFERLMNEKYYIVHDIFAGLCNDLDIEYYDLNYVNPILLDRSLDDYSDVDGHMFGILADRQTKLLDQILMDDNKDKFFIEDYENLIHTIKNMRYAK